MKRLSALLIFLSFAVSANAQEINLKRIDFVNKFYLAVINHKQSKVIKCTDKTYRKEQIKFLGGNKEQFVDELLSGPDINGETFINNELKNIESIEITDVNELNENEWEYTFLVGAGPYNISLTLLLVKRKNKLGFVGASG